MGLDELPYFEQVLSHKQANLIEIRMGSEMRHSRFLNSPIVPFEIFWPGGQGGSVNFFMF